VGGCAMGEYYMMGGLNLQTQVDLECRTQIFHYKLDSF